MEKPTPIEKDLWPYAYDFKIPVRSDWTCNLCCEINYIPPKGCEPNWFHRWMQGLCFGFKWSKKK